MKNYETIRRRRKRRRRQQWETTSVLFQENIFSQTWQDYLYGQLKKSHNHTIKVSPFFNLHCDIFFWQRSPAHELNQRFNSIVWKWRKRLTFQAGQICRCFSCFKWSHSFYTSVWKILIEMPFVFAGLFFLLFTPPTLELRTASKNPEKITTSFVVIVPQEKWTEMVFLNMSTTTKPLSFYFQNTARKLYLFLQR